MAVAILGANFSKLIISVKPVCKKPICRLNKKSIFPILSAGISGKSTRDSDYKRPPPYPYKEKNYGLIRSWLDRTTHRFDENSKLIVVEGPIAAGKSAFAKELAADLDMLYVPQTTMDDFYINPYGYDMRKLDEKLPNNLKSFDEKNFCMTPNGLNSAIFQVMLYQLRFSKYVDSLAHILSTGQGVVMVRSCFSDYIFMEASFRSGYISKEARSVYHDLKRHTIYELLRPHLYIYLDVPIPKVQENIKKRNLPHEVNGKALTEKYLSDLEDIYKHRFLKEISSNSELLIYDWTNEGDIEVVIEDIERLDFDQYTVHDTKLSDWRIKKEQKWADLRMLYADNKQDLMNYFNVPRYDCFELLLSGEEEKILEDIWYTAPGMKYEPGFNSDLGDTGIWTKSKTVKAYRA